MTERHSNSILRPVKAMNGILPAARQLARVLRLIGILSSNVFVSMKSAVSCDRAVACVLQSGVFMFRLRQGAAAKPTGANAML